MNLLEWTLRTEAVAERIRDLTDPSAIATAVADAFKDDERTAVHLFEIDSVGTPRLSASSLQTEQSHSTVASGPSQTSPWLAPVLHHGETVRLPISDLPSDALPLDRAQLNAAGHTETIATPLQRRGERVGLILLTGDALSEELDVGLRNLAHQIEAAWLCSESRGALEESRRRMDTLMGNLVGMVYRCSNRRSWTMEFVSEGSERLTGYRPRELMDDRDAAYGDLIHPEDRDMVWSRVQAALEQDRRFEIMYRIRTRDGSEKWVWEQGRGVFGVDGEVVALEGFISDVTERQRSAEALERALGGTIRIITQAAEARDPYTSGHQQRVAALAQRIALELGLSIDEQNGLRVAGLLHDVGKISVPSEILVKPGKLSDIEMRLVWGHVDAGYEILKEIEFPWPIADIVLQHHERMDGSGYPHQLLGKEILMEARIISVSDTVEAMSMHRPYRPALGIDVALDQIVHDRGTKLDVDVVDACVRVFRERQYSLDSPPIEGWPVLADFLPSKL